MPEGLKSYTMVIKVSLINKYICPLEMLAGLSFMEILKNVKNTHKKFVYLKKILFNINSELLASHNITLLRPEET